MKKIKSLCQRAVWLSEGVIKAIGPAEAVADQYLAASNQPPVG
jgi:ABC-type polysaccharide/polyol phosphate transport system ATPase subunit